MSTTLDRILSFIADEYTKTATPDSTLDNIGFDSLDIVEFETYLESEFGVTIHDGEIDSKTTLTAIAALVDSRKKIDAVEPTLICSSTVSVVFKNRDELLQQICIKLFGAVPKFTEPDELHTTRHECDELRAQLLQMTESRNMWKAAHDNTVEMNQYLRDAMVKGGSHE